MTGNNVVVDTNVFIDLMKGENTIAQKLKSFEEVYLSPIVLAELYFGAYRSANPEKHLNKVSIVIRDSKLLAIDEITSRYFVQIKLELFAKGKPIPENDIWIAASAFQYNTSVYTIDKHFNEIEGINLFS